MKVKLPSFLQECRALVFDIVTVEGEGCSAAGGEEMRGTRNGKQLVFREMTGLLLGFLVNSE